MKEFLLIYRADYDTYPTIRRSPEEMQAITQKWMSWTAGIATQGKLADRGNSLVSSGKVMKSNGSVSDGPYTEIKESIMGYSLVKASSIEEAMELADGCPILSVGGSIEIREIRAI
jgi:hypothetical protein